MNGLNNIAFNRLARSVVVSTMIFIPVFWAVLDDLGEALPKGVFFGLVFGVFDYVMADPPDPPLRLGRSGAFRIAVGLATLAGAAVGANALGIEPDSLARYAFVFGAVFASIGLGELVARLVRARKAQSVTRAERRPDAE